MAEMVERSRRVASVRVLERRVDALAAAGEVSASRARQLRMVVGMWDLALGAWPKGAPRPGRAVASLFEESALRAFWGLAVAGRLRSRGDGTVRPLAAPTRRVVRDCLGILADVVVPGRDVWLPEVQQPRPKATVPPGQLAVLYRRLVDMASDAPVEGGGMSLSPEDRVRLLAMMAVVLDTGARSGELESMRLPDLAAGESRLLVRRVPQNGDHLAYEEVCELREGTGVAVRRWLRVRRRLVAPLEGAAPDALWVSLRPNQWQPEPGFPLKAQGIQKAYGRGAVALNGLMAGRSGWVPLPTTLEQVRRAVALPDGPGAAAPAPPVGA
ncbi:hypothetical protein [Actinacidiphila acididurans]|uniref:Tyr recombinase domain-containing protein n=1 Tax=Actinacidiphila acididurans TaxID=2784346 RepID=A0ABS2U333_9ACTN|nr:hypothetical protein [Actinacidiphila acididurans]MBM9510015.1 hypothetical protein [Actinacidiphila acididurans]